MKAKYFDYRILNEGYSKGYLKKKIIHGIKHLLTLICYLISVISVNQKVIIILNHTFII